jgi:hypothetical protein
MNVMLMNLGLAPIYNPFPKFDAGLERYSDVPVQLEDSIVDYLEVNPGSTIKEISLAVSRSECRMCVVMRKMEQNRLVTSTREHKHLPARWRLA